MLNVEQITNRLAQMPDQMLQKYAAMNKSDPYIMALAVSESNRRKQLRQAAQGRQGMQPQPKVVDQDIAQMAAPMPEDMGIARIPAGDMNFAGGGIVAFADGGDVERYDDRGLVRPLSSGTEYGIPGMVQGNDYQNALAKAQRGEPLSDVEKALLASSTPLAAAADVLASPITAARRFIRSPNDQSALPSWTPATDELKNRLNLYESLPQASYSNEGRRVPTASVVNPAASVTTDKTAPKGDTTNRTAPPAAPSTDAGFGALMKAIKGSEVLADQVNPYVKQMEDLTATRVKAREKEAEGLEAIQKQYADIYKGKEERIAKREGELAGMKDQSLGLALLQAGAAMMSTPGSLGMALGKGVDVGSKQYVAGMDKLNAAKEKLSDARDRLEELQAQRGEMSAREMLKAKSAIDSEKAAGQELLIKANMDLYKINREEAIKRLDMQTRVGIEQLREQGATARAQLPGSQERLFTMLGGTDAASLQAQKGLSKYADIMGPEAKGLQALLAKYADPIALQTLKTTDPELYNYVSAQLRNQMRQPTSAPTGPVRP